MITELGYEQVKQRKQLRRKLLFTQRRRIPRSASNPRCARLRLWYKEASTRRKQLKAIADLRTKLVRELTDDADRATISLSLFVGVAESLHKISCTLPQSRPLKRQRSSDLDTYPTPLNPLAPPYYPASVLGKRPRPP